MSDKCPRCGAEQPRDAPGGLCPRCLAQTGMDLSLGEDEAPSPAGDRAVSGGAPQGPAGEAGGSMARRSLGDYELLEEIGRGGMGMVYRARQRSLDRIVAIKVMAFGPGASPELVKRFRAEAIAAASLHHPNIVAIHEVGIHEGQHFFVMDYVEGESLARLASSQVLPVKRAAALLKTIAEAVHYAHERGILHRDLKPSNVLIDAQDQPHVVDFGLARQLQGDSELTVTGQVLGSPNYLPPEQAAGQRTRVSRRSDVYALGATLYHLLTGRPPFQAESLAQTLDLALRTDPVAPRLLNPGAPRDLETICLKCLEKEPSRRYATARELADELGRFQAGEAILARPLGPAGKVGRWCRRQPQVATLAAVALLAISLGFASLMWQKRQAKTSELAARQNAYALAMNAADQALKANEPGRAATLLDRQRPASKSETDLRGFEWRYLWQQCQIDAEAVIGRLPSAVRCLKVSPDARWLAAGGELGGLKLWDLATTEEITLQQAYGTRLRTFAAFSPDSRLLLFVDGKYDSPPPLGQIAIFDLGTRKRLAPITDLRGIGPMAFSPDGRRVVCGVALRWLHRPAAGRGGVVMDFASRQTVAQMVAETDQINRFFGSEFALTPDSRSAIYAEIGPQRELVLWDFAPDSKRHFPIPGEPITAMAISPDGHTLATGSGLTETVIRLWEVPTFRSLGELVGHSRWVMGLEFSPDGQTLASASADQTIRLWDLATRTPRGTPHRLRDEAWRVFFSPDGRKLFGGSKDGYVYRWSTNAAPEQPVTWARATGLGPRSIVLAADGKGLAGIGQGVVYLADDEGAAPPRPLLGLGTNNACVLFSADGQSLFAGTQTGELQVWSLTRQELLHRLRNSEEPVRYLLRDSRARRLVFLQWANPLPLPLPESEISQIAKGREQFYYGFQVEQPARVGVWSSAEAREQMSWKIPGGVTACAVSPDGQFLATSHGQGTVYLWNLNARCRSNSVACSGRVAALTFSADGRWLAAAVPLAGLVRVWELPGLRWRADLPHPDAVTGLSFSPDGKRLATASGGANGLWLWDVASWQPLFTFGRPQEDPLSPTFNGNGNQFNSVTSSGEVLFWRAPSFEEIEAKEKKTRPR